VIAYLDTSVVVPILINEPTSGTCRELWRTADRPVSTRLLYIETVSAIEQARMMKRITESGATAAEQTLGSMWPDVSIIELDQQLMMNAAVMARRFGLRGYDSVHCAAALQINDRDFLAATADQTLSQAWSELGLKVFNPE